MGDISRSKFLKLFATLVAAPTLMGETAIKPYDEKNEQKIQGDRIRIYPHSPSDCRAGDLIISEKFLT